MAQSIPAVWHAAAHTSWLKGQKDRAVQAVLAAINGHGEKKPLPLVIQLSYYLYLIGDFRAAAGFIERVRPHYPKNAELLLNLGVLWSRAGDYEQSVACMNELIAIAPDHPVAFDSLANSLYRLGRGQEARQAGTRALMLKDAASKARQKGYSVPPCGPGEWLDGTDKRQVVSFSLWGDNPRYLRGAIDNAVRGPVIYPGWTLRFLPRRVCASGDLSGPR